MKKELVKELIGLALENETEISGGELLFGKGEWRIAVLQRGWIMVGEYYREGEYIRLENAFNIERWGTTEGLGELADKGKQNDTRLRKCNKPVHFHKLTEVFSIECNQKSWK